MISIPSDLPGHAMDIFDHSCICNVCNQPFGCIEDLKEHIISPVLGVFVCCKCGSKFGDEKTFRLHLREHKRLKYVAADKLVGSSSGKLIDNRVNNMFICKYCDAPFKDRIDFYNHSMTHMKKTGNNARKPLKSRVIHEIHSMVDSQHHPSQKIEIKNLYDCIKYKCIVCHEGFFQADKVIAHSRKCAGNSRSCDLCQRLFEDNLILFEHYEVLHKESRRMCRFCFNTFPNENQLQQHIMRTHLKCLHFCHECKEGFDSLDRFNDHVKTVHGLFYCCNDCDKEFSSLALLNLHLQTHKHMKC